MRKVESKSTPYIPKSFSKDIDLNGEVAVSALGQRAGAATALVHCRHFATAFAKLKGKKRPLMRRFETPQGIRAHFQKAPRGLDSANIAFLRILSKTKQESRRLFNSEHLGRYLSAVAQSLGGGIGAPHEANCLLLTSEHAMAAHIQRKCKDGVTYFGVKVYDPNATAAYKRITVLDPADLERMALKDLLILSPAHYAAPEQSTLLLSAFCLEKEVQLATPQEELPATVESLFMAMEFGFADHVTAAVDFFRKKYSDSPDELFAALQSANAMQVQGMTAALYLGQVESIQAFANALATMPLSAEQKAELLAGRDTDGKPGLHGAMQSGMHQSVTAFIAAVTSTGLPIDTQTELLAARSAEGFPALWSVNPHHASVVQTYFRDVVASALPEQKKVELFTAKDASGTPALYAICDEDVGPLTAAFALAVTASNLSEEQKVVLLAAKNANGVPALFTALEVGNFDAAVAYIRRVLASSLAAAEQVSLLAAQDLTGLHGLHRAFVNGRPDTVGAFVQLVASAPHLSESQKLSLLATKDADGKSSAVAADEADEVDCVEAFIWAVVDSELPKKRKLEIFRDADLSFEEGDYLDDAAQQREWRDAL